MRILSGRAAGSMVQTLASRGAQPSKIEPQVQGIIADVRRRGDRALCNYAERWDGLARGQVLRVSKEELEEAWQSISPKLRRSLREAAANIRRFAQWQKPASFRRNGNGIALGQLVLPLDSVGCYVPGGRYPLVSTTLMTVVPAQVAGVSRIVVASPKPSREVMAAAAMLKVTEFYRVGGAQAIAALAYGTETIARVDKIVGPGNAYVTMAKKLVSFDCAIDFLAGPTEALVLSHSGRGDFIAADLVCQAEHDPDAVAVFITTSRRLAESVADKVTELVRENPIARKSLSLHGAILVADSKPQAREWANAIACEHITVSKQDLPFIRNAGSVFVGDYSPQAAGDYASGPNHVLPTSGQARFRGGLSVLDFVKVVTVQDLSHSGLRKIAPSVECLADTEGLPAHAHSIRVRCGRA
ncbi:MAG TPA: histidinol dehydrogenase [Candidatus Sulfotelmatobacter sp.]|nr:histidinol dehydrogenase [Candidatus Sulfotelmatobacter sp.]